MRDRQQESRDVGGDGSASRVRIIQHVLRRNALVGKVNAIGVRLKSIQSDISVSGGCPFVLIDKGSPLIYDIQRSASGGSILCETTKRPCSEGGAHVESYVGMVLARSNFSTKIR